MHDIIFYFLTMGYVNWIWSHDSWVIALCDFLFSSYTSQKTCMGTNITVSPKQVLPPPNTTIDLNTTTATTQHHRQRPSAGEAS